jgi:hypothetical protein
MGTSDNFQELVLHLPDLTRTGVAAAQWSFTMRNQEPFDCLVRFNDNVSITEHFATDVSASAYN